MEESNTNIFQNLIEHGWVGRLENLFIDSIKALYGCYFKSTSYSGPPIFKKDLTALYNVSSETKNYSNWFRELEKVLKTWNSEPEKVSKL